jgi:hypothetical protein
VTAALEELVESLLYEGYALYPYTPGATKNATPTPFGIVYPPAYAERNTSTYERLRIQCVVEGEGELSAEVRFLQASGERHEGEERRIELPEPGRYEFSFPPLVGRAVLRVEDSKDGRRLVSCCVHNSTDIGDGKVGRSEALLSSLLSTHVVVRTSAGRFLSPLDHPGDSVNSYPVLATENDDAVLGAAIVLPDHPQLAPESHGGLFDNTEIEEALLLHVQALSDAERDEIAQQDPAVRAMIERASAATPEDLKRLHGRMTLRDPRAGEEQATAGGVTFKRGAKVVLRPDPDRDPYDRILHGMCATVERIFLDYDDHTRVNLAVIIDDDPASELMRETGRYHFFKPREVELVET